MVVNYNEDYTETPYHKFKTPGQGNPDWEYILDENRDKYDARIPRTLALENRPDAGTFGRIWISTDDGEETIYLDNGSTWVAVAGKNLGTETITIDDIVFSGGGNDIRWDSSDSSNLNIYDTNTANEQIRFEGDRTVIADVDFYANQSVFLDNSLVVEPDQRTAHGTPDETPGEYLRVPGISADFVGAVNNGDRQVVNTFGCHYDDVEGAYVWDADAPTDAHLFAMNGGFIIFQGKDGDDGHLEGDTITEWDYDWRMRPDGAILDNISGNVLIGADGLFPRNRLGDYVSLLDENQDQTHDLDFLPGANLRFGDNKMQLRWNASGGDAEAGAWELYDPVSSNVLMEVEQGEKPQFPYGFTMRNLPGETEYEAPDDILIRSRAESISGAYTFTNAVNINTGDTEEALDLNTGDLNGVGDMSFTSEGAGTTNRITVPTENDGVEIVDGADNSQFFVFGSGATANAPNGLQSEGNNVLTTASTLDADSLGGQAPSYYLNTDSTIDADTLGGENPDYYLSSGGVNQGSHIVVEKIGSTTTAYKTEDGSEISSGSDEDTVISAAFSALTSGRSRKEVIAFSGEFSLSSVMNPPADCVLDCRNAYFTVDGSHDVISIENDNVNLIGGTFDGSGQTDNDAYRCVIQAASCNNVKIIEATAQNGGYYGINIYDSNNILVKDCYSYYNYRHGYHSGGSNDGLGTGVIFYNCTAEDTRTEWGFSCRLSSHSTTNLTTRLSNCYVKGGENGIALSNDGDKDSLGVLENCVVEDVVGDAFYLTNGDHKVTNCVARNPGDVGFYMRDWDTSGGCNISLVNCKSDGAGGHAYRNVDMNLTAFGLEAKGYASSKYADTHTNTVSDIRSSPDFDYTDVGSRVWINGHAKVALGGDAPNLSGSESYLKTGLTVEDSDNDGVLYYIAESDAVEISRAERDKKTPNAHIPSAEINDADYAEILVNVPSGMVFSLWGYGCRTDAQTNPTNYTVSVENLTSASNVVNKDAAYDWDSTPLGTVSGPADLALRLSNDTGSTETGGAQFSYSLD